MCTSFIISAKDGSTIYGRTMEWGGFDLESELGLVPRGRSFISMLSDTRKGMTWTNEFGFVVVNAIQQPYALDGMNESGLTVGFLYFPGFAGYQDTYTEKDSVSLNNADLTAWMLGRFSRVADIRNTLPSFRVTYNRDLEKVIGASFAGHWIVTDETGASIIVEYIDGDLHIYDNRIGVMTNSPGYDWHLMNLRNYSRLGVEDAPADRQINGVSLAPFGTGSGMYGLPGDYTPPSRFVRAVAFCRTLLPFPDAEAGIREASRILHNFDIPKGVARHGEHAGEPIVGYTQYSIIGDLRNRRYYYWTEFNCRIRMVDLKRLDFKGDKVLSFPLDKVRVEDVQDRTEDFATMASTSSRREGATV